MPYFIDVHSGMKGITQQQLQEEHDKDLKNGGSEGVHFLRAWADPSSGKVFCLSQGPSKEAVVRTNEKAGHPVDEIYEVPLSVE